MRSFIRPFFLFVSARTAVALLAGALGAGPVFAQAPEKLGIASEAAALTALAAGDTNFALVAPAAALRARAAGAPIKAVYVVDGHYLIASERAIAQSPELVATTLREWAARSNGQVPGPAQTAALGITAAKIASSEPQLPAASLLTAATTLVDRAPARGALARPLTVDPRCGNFCDQW